MEMDQVRTALSKQDPGSAPLQRHCVASRGNANCQLNETLIGNDRSGLKERSLTLEETVFRPGQAETFPQCLSLIPGAENLPLLQFRHHLVDEVVEARGQERKHDVETVGTV